MTIHFKADLRPVVGERTGMLHWIMDPACSGFIIAYDLGSNHVLISNFDVGRHPLVFCSQLTPDSRRSMRQIPGLNSSRRRLFPPLSGRIFRSRFSAIARGSSAERSRITTKRGIYSCASLFEPGFVSVVKV